MSRGKGRVAGSNDRIADRLTDCHTDFYKVRCNLFYCRISRNAVTCTHSNTSENKRSYGGGCEDDACWDMAS
jgi:hypothetical protein